MSGQSYIIFAKRTPIGSFGGSLSGVRIDDLLSELFKHYAEVAKHPINEIDDVIIGCANQAGEDNRNLARMSLLLANYPMTVTGTTLNRLCGLVCPSRTSEREGEGYCVKGGWREGEERVRRSVNPIPNPDPNPTQAPQMSLKEA